MAHPLPMKLTSVTALLLGLALVLLAACSPSFPAPELWSVAPDWAFNGESTKVSVTGRNLFPRVELETRDEGAYLDRGYRAYLLGSGEAHSLEGVDLQSDTELAATVPKGLPVGRYDLQVVSPSGHTAVLSDAFAITDTRADRLVLKVDSVAQEVTEPFLLGVEIWDPAEVVLPQPFAVELVFSAPSGLQELELAPVGLTGFTMEMVDGQVRATGSLEPTGEGSLWVTAMVPETLEVRVSPAEEGSPVNGDTLLLAISTGQLVGVEVGLPEDPFEVAAGEPFVASFRMVDTHGNTLVGSEGTLFVTETCGSLSRAVSIIGEVEVELSVTGATGSSCPENHLQVVGTTSGTSAGFQVRAGPAAAYGVQVYPSVVAAGEGLLYALIEAQDAFGNPFGDYQDPGVRLTDTLGGLDSASGIGSQSCPGFSGGTQLCQAELWVAGEGNRILATGADGISGISGTFDVVAGALDEIRVALDSTTAVAGSDFLVTVTLLDGLGNFIQADPSATTFTFRSTTGGLTCGWDGAAHEGGERVFNCVSTVATASEQVTVSLDTVDPHIVGVSPAFTVLNGALAVLDVALPAGTMVAGTSFPVTLAGYDSWGNPYTYQTDPVVDIADDTGTSTPTQVTLDADGTGAADVTITAAAESDVLEVSQGGALLGQSRSFDVVAGTLASFDVEPERPWAWVGEPLEVTVTAVDAWGNTVTGFGGVVTLTAVSGGETALLDDFVDGLMTTELTMSGVQLAEELLATGADTLLTGSYLPLDVLEAACGNEATLLADGVEDEVVLCLVSGVASTTLTSDWASAYLHHFWDPTGNEQRGSSSTAVFSWEEGGVVEVELVSADAAGCGAWDMATVWVAPSDGEPAGPVEVSPRDLSLVAGSSPGTTTVDLLARDCTGDPAIGGTIFMRTDLGEITGGVSTGQGLTMTLNSSGEASATLSVASLLSGGTLTFHAGRPGDLAYGSGTVAVLGDSISPVVLEIQPVGTTAEIVDALSVWFSEPMRSSSFSASTVTLEDSSGIEVSHTRSLEEGDQRLDLLLDEALDLGADAYHLFVGSQIRDRAGNRLDGTWSGTPASLEVDLGAVSNTAPAVHCVAVNPLFRPDGDDVPGTEEADQVEIQVAAGVAPTWWLLQITNQAGEGVLTRWGTATSAAETLTWGGTDQEGLVLQNGVYDVEVYGADLYLNLGAPCLVEVTLDNYLEGS